MFNLKQLSQAVIYLKEHGNMSYEDLQERTAAVTDSFNTLSAQIKDLESQMTANGELQKQIVNYAKTRAVYIEYRKAGYSKKFRAEHEAEILLHQAAKKHFDSLGITKLPSVKSLREEYAQELAIKAQYKEAEKAGSEEGKEAAQKAYQELEEQIAARGNTYARIYRLYSEAKERGNEYIDLNDTIWEDKVKPLIDSLREYGIEKFTFSSTWSSAVEIAWLFTQNGCRLEGLVEINSQYKETWGSEYKKAHGYLFSIN